MISSWTATTVGVNLGLAATASIGCRFVGGVRDADGGPLGGAFGIKKTTLKAMAATAVAIDAPIHKPRRDFGRRGAALGELVRISICSRSIREGYVQHVS